MTEVTFTLHPGWASNRFSSVSENRGTARRAARMSGPGESEGVGPARPPGGSRGSHALWHSEQHLCGLRGPLHNYTTFFLGNLSF